MTVVWVFSGAGVLVLGLVVWLRARRDLESHQNMGEVLPSPDEDDHPRWTVDLHRSQVRIPRLR